MYFTEMRVLTYLTEKKSRYELQDNCSQTMLMVGYQLHSVPAMINKAVSHLPALRLRLST